MYQCPECCLPLKTSPTKENKVTFKVCPNCLGKMVGFGAARKLIGDSESNQLWRKSGNVSPNGRPCPSCSRPLRTLMHEKHPVAVELDVCRECYILWLDQGEDVNISMLSQSRQQLHLNSTEILDYARCIADHVRHSEEAKNIVLHDGGPNEIWKWIPALVGLPVELDQRYLRRQPLVSYSVIFLSILAVMVTVKNVDPDQFIKTYGFISNHPFAKSGLTLVTSFFMHGGWLHVLSNMYIFFVFADDVEDDLGHINLFVMLLGSHILGLIANTIVSGSSDAPLVGASAGVFGILAYYMVRFPRTKVGVLYLFFFRPYWIRFSAVWLVAYKIVTELFLSIFLSRHTVGIAHAAHVGGALVGLFFGYYIKSVHLDRKPLPE